MKPWFALMGVLVLGGCASWGGNVSGDFACKAPQGTCAPTAEIDARAVERAARSQRQAGPAPSPAGVWASRTALGAGLVRTGERVLRIVFYPRIDEAGVFHEPAVVHAVVEGSGWQALPSSPPSIAVAPGSAAAPPAVISEPAEDAGDTGDEQ